MEECEDFFLKRLNLLSYKSVTHVKPTSPKKCYPTKATSFQFLIPTTSSTKKALQTILNFARTLNQKEDPPTKHNKEILHRERVYTDKKGTIENNGL